MTLLEFSNAGGADPGIVSVLIRIAKKTRALLGIRLAELGLMTGEDEIIGALQQGRTTSVSALSATLFVRFPTMLKAVDNLVERGFLERLAGPLVRLSDKGAAVQPEIATMRARIARDLLSDLGAERLDRLTADLEELDLSLNATISPTP